MAQPRVGIKEATRLTGRSRRSIYRDMSTGALSYHIDPKGHRYLDVSELIRAYGPLEGKAGPDPEPESPASTEQKPGSLADDTLAELLAVMKEQRDELKALRQEVVELRGQLALPAPGKLASDKPPPDPDTQSAQPKPAKVEPEPRKPVSSFGDLIERLKSRTQT